MKLARNIKFILKKNMKIYKIIYRNNHSTKNILKLAERGLWNDRFPQSCLEFEKNLGQCLTVYSGFDPTASSLHIGNLLVLNALIHFQRSGHKVIALVGGATGRVGDPSGKNKERPLLSIEDVEENCDKIKTSIETIFRNHEEFIWNISNKDKLQPIQIVDNFEWYKKKNLITFFRDVGKHMRMGTLLKRSAIESRLEANLPLSFTEFSYQIMQAYDWLHLYQKYNCTVQVGGSDQMGNIISGQQLISRVEDYQVTGLTVPLITSESGDKLGKSSGSPVWLSPEKNSPFDFYQFFVRTKDSEVEKLLKLLTFIPMHEIDTLMELHKQDPGSRRAQKRLANHVTTLVFGEEGLKRAKKATSILYENQSQILAEMSAQDVLNMFKGSTVVKAVLKPGITVLDVAVLANCFPFEGRAFEVIEKGGFYINEGKVNRPTMALLPDIHILPNRLSILRVGKKNYYIVDWN